MLNSIANDIEVAIIIYLNINAILNVNFMQLTKSKRLFRIISFFINNLNKILVLLQNQRHFKTFHLALQKISKTLFNIVSKCIIFFVFKINSAFTFRFQVYIYMILYELYNKMIYQIHQQYICTLHWQILPINIFYV